MTRIALFALSILLVSSCGGPETPGTSSRCGDRRIGGSEECDDGNSIDTDSCTSECKKAACGDGVLRGDLSPGIVGFEACDDGNDFNEDACLTLCAVAVCGDGVVRTDIADGEDGYEACDDANDD
ncbi:MAG TPA: DUF4215 domain-containing protein, partial [Planctomycetes bacterium]|nr:DUF4215 domain-containing protein [Planctomycetota bacterium]